MQYILFQLRRFFLMLGDLFLYPMLKIRELWSDQGRGRALLFGLPALLIAILAVAVALLAISSKNQFAENYKEAKEQAESEKDWSEAIVYMRKLMQLRPDDKSTKFELGRILALDTRKETAQSNQKEAQAIWNSLSPDDHPGYADAHIWKAKSIMTISDERVTIQQKMDSAEKHLRFALEADPDNTNAMTLLAERILVPRRQYEEAFEIYARLFDDYVAYYVKIAELAVLTQQPQRATPYLKEAITRYEKLIEEHPDNFTYLRRRANAFAMMGKHDKAAQSLIDANYTPKNRAEEQAFDRALARIYLAHALTLGSQLQTDESARQQYLDLLRKAFEVDPEDDKVQTAITTFGLQDFEISKEALAIYDPRDNPDEAPDSALQPMGTREVLYGDRELGIRLLELAVQKNPRNHEALNNLAYTIIDSDLERALELANRAIGLIPRDTSEKGHYLDTRANIHMRMGNYNKAILDFEMALKLMTDLTDEGKLKLYRKLIECFQAEEMTQSAKALQQKADELESQINSNTN